MDSRLYVLRNEKDGITKVGRSTSPNTRIYNINQLKKANFKLVYYSQVLDYYTAVKVEEETINFFKYEAVEGREWLSTDPLKVTSFILDRVGLPEKSQDLKNIYTKYKSWITYNSHFDNLVGEKQTNGLKISANYIGYLQLLYNSRLTTICFCNLGDAYKVANAYKYNVQALDYLPKLLWGKTLEQWKEEEKDNKDYLNRYILLKDREKYTNL